MITDFRINAKGELEGKVIPPAKWEAMYTKEQVVAMLTDIQLEIEECVDGAEGSPEFEQGVSNARVQVVEMIQDRIDKLKGE